MKLILLYAIHVQWSCFLPSNFAWTSNTHTRKNKNHSQRALCLIEKSYCCYSKIPMNNVVVFWSLQWRLLVLTIISPRSIMAWIVLLALPTLSFASWSATISAARAVGEIYSFRSKVKINLATHPQLGNEIWIGTLSLNLVLQCRPKLIDWLLKYIYTRHGRRWCWRQKGARGLRTKCWSKFVLWSWISWLSEWLQF